MTSAAVSAFQVLAKGALRVTDSPPPHGQGSSDDETSSKQRILVRRYVACQNEKVTLDGSWRTGPGEDAVTYTFKGPRLLVLHGEHTVRIVVQRGEACLEGFIVRR